VVDPPNAFARAGEFVPALLAACPELDGDWIDETVRDPERSYGAVYSAFWHAILPTLVQLLDPTDSPHTAPPGVATVPAEDLLPRMYSVIERAAISPDAGLRTAVVIELGDGGYRRLSRADLYRYAGAHTRRLLGAPD
jgi:hypothetical protein